MRILLDRALDDLPVPELPPLLILDDALFKVGLARLVLLEDGRGLSDLFKADALRVLMLRQQGGLGLRGRQLVIRAFRSGYGAVEFRGVLGSFE